MITLQTNDFKQLAFNHSGRKLETSIQPTLYPPLASELENYLQLWSTTQKKFSEIKQKKTNRGKNKKMLYPTKIFFNSTTLDNPRRTLPQRTKLNILSPLIGHSFQFRLNIISPTLAIFLENRK